MAHRQQRRFHNWLYCQHLLTWDIMHSAFHTNALTVTSPKFADERAACCAVRPHTLVWYMMNAWSRPTVCQKLFVTQLAKQN